ncbi:hypothetical protein GC175_17725 [bacterium]|nr:hypothetical protein [bacterium]
MFDPSRAQTALEQKRESFTRYFADLGVERQRTETLFEQFRHMTAQEIADRLAEKDNPWPGAEPTDEIDAAKEMCIGFEEQWQNHRDARTWALSVLYKRPSLAVDGSQITPTKDYSVPVGAVQIGWFVNEHLTAQENGTQTYIKDVSFEVLPPAELGEEDDPGDGDFPNWRVNQMRFVRECEKLCELMESYADRPYETRPLCFFDGSFAISFAGQLRPERARPYLRAVEKLLACSQRTEVPLVGFVDSAYSQDLVTLLNNLFGGVIHQSSDARLLEPVLTHWGERSPLFICARSDQLSTKGNANFYREICFTYVNLVTDRPPARVELPRWIYEQGHVDDVLNRVRAECVVGTGYPYVIETADAVAVISQQDRERFYRLFQQFLAKEGIELSMTRKLRSKLVRR